MRWLLPVTCTLLLALPASAQKMERVTILHFTDYHSHAVPFFADGEKNVGGIARAIGYLKPLAKNPDTLVLSGGDMMNKGAPAWSDKFGCTEWGWLDGTVSAMALGNHDADYGNEAFAKCRAATKIPILSANVLGADGKNAFPAYAVFTRGGVKIGVFAVAGPDFDALIKPAISPVPSIKFTDRIEAARNAVKALREKEKVNAVVLIGHEQRDADLQLATRVPGIDLILGTHAHVQRDLSKIPSTGTWTIAAAPYLASISRLELSFRDGVLEKVTGSPVRMSPGLPEDPEIAARVKTMQAELQADPRYAPLYVRIARLETGLSVESSTTQNSPFGALVAEAMRAAGGADVGITTASSIREPLPSGAIVEEQLRAALPYPNRILTYELKGDLLGRILDASAARKGTDVFLQTAGVTLRADGGRALDVKISGKPLDPRGTYHIATTDYLALVAEPYRTLLAGLAPHHTQLEVRTQVRTALSKLGSGAGGTQ
ncbi:MAG: bifunctional UDP-sugar hydrolase/5'-nucleotidase [Thermoanaerobaculia bacterium]